MTISAERVAWVVFYPTGEPYLPATRGTYDDAMQACFGNRHHGRKDYWQENLNAGWTCRAISLDVPAPVPTTTPEQHQ